MQPSAHLPELGTEVGRYRPLRGWQARGVCALLGFLASGQVLLVPSDRWLYSVPAFVGCTLLWAAMLCDTLWIEHRLHEHGLWLVTRAPVVASYAVPYTTIDPGSIATSNWYRNRAKGVIIDRRLRQVPFMGASVSTGWIPPALST